MFWDMTSVANTFFFFNLFVSILKTLEACVYGERECTMPRWHHNLKNKWCHKLVPYVLYASACGSLSAVKYFIASGQEPNIRYLGKQSVSYSIEDCAACFKYVNVTNTVQCRYCKTGQSALILFKSKPHPKLLTVLN